MTVESYMYGKFDDTVNIPKAEYDDLVSDSAFLAALEQAGVDNWDGYGFAQEIFEAFKVGKTNEG